MKLKFNSLIIIMYLFATCFSLLSLLVSEGCTAQENRAEISFLGKPTYKLVSTADKNLGVWRYEINVTLQNTGNKKSDELTVNLKSETDSLNETTIIEPKNTSLITFQWGTISDKDQEITISFYPSAVDAVKNPYNSGSTSFTIIVGDIDPPPSEKTPGFEIFVMVLSLISITIYFRNKRK